MQRNYNLKEIPIDLIEANPHQPRKVFDDETINELSESIKLYGIVQPLSVRKLANKKYELIAGERRLRAAKKAGLKKIPVIITKVTDKDSAFIAIIENIQRENLSFIEEAEGYKKLIDSYGYSQQDIANSVGKSQSTIANKLRILKFSPDIRDKIKDKNLTERHARALLKIEDDDTQIEIIDIIIEESLNVKKTEELVDKYINENINDSNEASKNINNKKNKVKVKNGLKDVRIINNTFLQAIKMLENTGLKVNYSMQERDDSYEIKIIIPFDSK